MKRRKGYPIWRRIPNRSHGTSAIPFLGSHSRNPSDYSTQKYTMYRGSHNIGNGRVLSSHSTSSLPSRMGFLQQDNTSSSSIPSGHNVTMGITYSSPEHAARSLPPVGDYFGQATNRVNSPPLSFISRSTETAQHARPHGRGMSNDSVPSLHERTGSFSSSNEMPEGTISPFVLPPLVEPANESLRSPDLRSTPAASTDNSRTPGSPGMSPVRREVRRKNPPPYRSTPGSPVDEEMGTLSPGGGRRSVAESQILLGTTLVPGMSRQASTSRVLDSPRRNSLPLETSDGQNPSIIAMRPVRKETS